MTRERVGQSMSIAGAFALFGAIGGLFGPLALVLTALVWFSAIVFVASASRN